MARKYLNNYTTLLSAAITDTDTTMTVGTTPAALAAGDYYRLQISLRNAQGVLTKQEFVDVTAISGNDLTITRAAEGSTALSWDTGTRVELVETAASWDGLDTDAEVTQAIADHVAEIDPHPQYTTESEAAAAAPVQSVDGKTGAVDLSGDYEAKRQNNLTATSDPTVNDDDTAGYEPLSRWINTSTGEIWLCVSAATGAANWQQASLTIDELGSAAVADIGTGAGQVPVTGDYDPAGSAADAQDYAIQRANHTGTQAISTVTGLQTALDGKATAAQGAKADTALQALPHSFNKQDRASRLFELSGSTLQTAQPVSLDVDGTIITLAVGAAVTLPTLASHTDYMIYCSQSGALSAQPWDDAAPANSRAIGGFHAYHTTATINPHSIWDLGYRPTANPRGMTQCPTGDWVDIYLMDVDYGINGYSRGGVTIADGNSPPKIPAIYGGDGTAAYGSLTWFEAVDLAAAAGKRLLTYAVFTAAAYGVVERQSVGTDPVTTKYQAGHRSACGMEQATGCLWQWGEDINGTTETGTASWQDITGRRGDIFTHSIRAVLLGANWGNASYSGSRASNWYVAPGSSNSNISARASCGHMTL